VVGSDLILAMGVETRGRSLPLFVESGENQLVSNKNQSKNSKALHNCEELFQYKYLFFNHY